MNSLVLRFRALVLCDVLLCFGASAVAQEPSTAPAEVLTLEQAVTLAQENNRLIKISHQSVLQANDQILAVRTQRYPHFNIQLTGSYLLTAVHVSFPQASFGFVNNTPVPNTNSVLTTEPQWSALAYVDAYQPLAELYNIHLNVEAAQVAKKLSEEQLRQQRQQIINSVKDAYYGMLQTQSALDSATDNVKFLHELDRTTEQYVAEKTALPYQSIGVKAQLAQADLQVVTLEDTLATQKENFNNLMGRDLGIDFRLSGVPEELPEEKTLEAARQAVLDRSSNPH
ncbi:MAG TPA: TolC family protein [Candidatus Methylomirabilis sp.]|nr:TolC family protein [Candidatus Methylomirabilis sp.]